VIRTATQSSGSTPGFQRLTSSEGSMIELIERPASVVDSIRKRGCGQVLPSQSGSMVQPMSMPHVASGWASRAGTVIGVSPKHASASTASMRQSALTDVGRLGQSGVTSWIHGVPSLSAAATQPIGSSTVVAASPIGATSYQVYPLASTGPSMTKSRRGASSSGSSLTDESLTSGFERTRRSVVTTFTTESCGSCGALGRGSTLGSGATLPGTDGDGADGSALGVAEGPAGADGEATGGPDGAGAGAAHAARATRRTLVASSRTRIM
jgi:hypothetical protein